MDLAGRHPAIETVCGTALTCLGSGIHFADEWLTPALSFGAALIGFIFAVHGAGRWVVNRKQKSRRKDDRHGH